MVNFIKLIVHIIKAARPDLIADIRHDLMSLGLHALFVKMLAVENRMYEAIQ